MVASPNTVIADAETRRCIYVGDKVLKVLTLHCRRLSPSRYRFRRAEKTSQTHRLRVRWTFSDKYMGHSWANSSTNPLRYCKDRRVIAFFTSRSPLRLQPCIPLISMNHQTPFLPQICSLCLHSLLLSVLKTQLCLLSLPLWRTFFQYREAPLVFTLVLCPLHHPPGADSLLHPGCLLNGLLQPFRSPIAAVEVTVVDWPFRCRSSRSGRPGGLRSCCGLILSPRFAITQSPCLTGPSRSAST